MKALRKSRPSKDEREKQTLLKLVELFIDSGKPVGSNTLHEEGLDHISSATIRNYFAKLEEEGFLTQHHSSGGRVPTPKALRCYLEEMKPCPLDGSIKKSMREALAKQTRGVALYLQQSCDWLARASGSAVFLSTPRFEQDFLTQIRLLPLDGNRVLCVVLTDFGLVHTETLVLTEDLSSFAVKRLESYFRFRLTGLDRPSLSPEEEELAQRIYSEVLLRHVVRSSQFQRADLIKAGFAGMLDQEPFQDAGQLAGALSLFEDDDVLAQLLGDAQRLRSLAYFVGDELSPYSPRATHCAAITVPYRIHSTIVGAVGLLGPLRMPYKQLVPLLTETVELISASLTESVYKFRLTFRSPSPRQLDAALERSSSLATPLLTHTRNRSHE